MGMTALGRQTDHGHDNREADQVHGHHLPSSSRDLVVRYRHVTHHRVMMTREFTSQRGQPVPAPQPTHLVPLCRPSLGLYPHLIHSQEAFHPSATHSQVARPPAAGPRDNAGETGSES